MASENENGKYKSTQGTIALVYPTVRELCCNRARAYPRIQPQSRQTIKTPLSLNARGTSERAEKSDTPNLKSRHRVRVYIPLGMMWG